MRHLSIESGSLGYRRMVLLESFSLQLQGGGVYELRGENGAGKSTLLRALVGLHPLHAGRRTSNFQRHALVPQTSTLDPQYPLTVHGFLDLYGTAKMDLILRFGLGSCLDRLLRECSGGELQKALIVRALMTRPDFLAIDEPSALDSAAKAALMEVCKESAKQGGCVVICTHDSYGFDSSGIRIEIRAGQVNAAHRRRKRGHA